MVLAAHAENVGVAGEVGLDQDALRRHLLEEVVGPVLIHDIDAMADPVGARLLYRKPDMAAKSLRRHEPRRKLPGMQGHAHLGIELAQEADDPHVLCVVCHRDHVILCGPDAKHQFRKRRYRHFTGCQH
jgi:hypothetical protein